MDIRTKLLQDGLGAAPIESAIASDRRIQAEDLIGDESMWICYLMDLNSFLQKGNYAVVRIMKPDSTTLRGIAVAKSSISEFDKLNRFIN